MRLTKGQGEIMDIEKVLKELVNEKIEAMATEDARCEKCDELHWGRSYKLGGAYPAVLCLRHIKEYVEFSACSDWWWDYQLAKVSFEKDPTRGTVDWYAEEGLRVIEETKGWLKS